MTKSQRRQIVGRLHNSVVQSFDRIDQLESENKNGLEHTIARERLYDLLKIKDQLVDCKPFIWQDFSDFEKMLAERIRPNGRLKYSWYGHI